MIRHASNATRAELREHGATSSDAILLDEDIDQDTPTIPRSERPRIESIMRDHWARSELLDALRTRGITLAQASPDGNCAQRSAGCSAGRLSRRAAVSSDAGTMEELRSQRGRIVARVGAAGGEALPSLPCDANGPSISMHALRDALRVSAAAIQPFKRLGHWFDGGSVFIAFLWGLAEDLGVPIAVLQREADGTYVDPACVYRAQAPGGLRRRENAGAFSYVAIDELLHEWIDRSEAWPPPLALVEFVPGHYSPFLFAPQRQRGKPMAMRR